MPLIIAECAYGNAPVSAAQQALATRYVEAISFSALTEQCIEHHPNNFSADIYPNWLKQHAKTIQRGEIALDRIHQHQPFGAQEYAAWYADEQVLWFVSATPQEQISLCEKLAKQLAINIQN